MPDVLRQADNHTSIWSRSLANGLDQSFAKGRDNPSTSLSLHKSLTNKSTVATSILSMVASIYLAESNGLSSTCQSILSSNGRENELVECLLRAASPPTTPRRMIEQSNCATARRTGCLSDDRLPDYLSSHFSCFFTVMDRISEWKP